ncbi:MAG: polyketide synthase, partial [Acidobacteriota bacterium]
MSPLKLALLAQRSAERDRAYADLEPIAVVGLASRFPGAPTPETFWQALHDGRHAVRAIPATRWSTDSQAGSAAARFFRFGSFLDDVDQFDAGFFHIAPREAAMMDPQQRLLLEVTWECLERAGLAPDRIRGSRTGCFVGMMGTDYARLTTRDL